MQRNDEIDFLAILKNPVRLFGLTYLYFLVAGGFVGAYYIWNMNDVSKNAIAPVVLKDSSQFVADIPMQRGALIPPVDVAVAGRTSKALVDKGANLFKTNCVSCHGENGMGDGQTAASLAVKPRNFHLNTNWKNGRKVSNMYKTLQEGILLSGMPSFNYMPAEDRFALIHYVRTFAQDFPVDSLNELMDLEKAYNLSKGSQLAPHIPVKLAMMKLQKEHEADAAAVAAAAASVGTGTEQGAAIAHRVAKNGTKLAAAALTLKDLSVDEFIRTVSSDPNMIGVSPSVLRLSREEWGAFHAYVAGLVKSKKG